MIVTADPIGDFNATSQILRYSALAREVTVPRIPSVTSTILSGTTAIAPNLRLNTSGRTSPSSPLPSSDELDALHADIARLTDALDIAHLQLSEECSRRRAAEASWLAAEDRAAAIEAEVRDEVCGALEARVLAERARWMGAWAEESERGEARWDAKVEILQRGIGGDEVEVYEDPQPGVEERCAELEEENRRLREKVEALERERLGRSPTKKVRALKTKKWGLEEMGESP